MKHLTFLLLFFTLLFTSCDSILDHKKETKIQKNDVVVNKPIDDSSFFVMSEIYHIDKFFVDTIRIVSMEELKGSSLYKIHCKMCHGEDGKGDGVKARLQVGICPHDLSKEDKPDEVVYYIILNGGTRMPPGQDKLSDSEAKVLVFHIKKFKE